MRAAFLSFLIIIFAVAAHAEIKTVRVFVALCDNVSQGIAPVPPKIGDGDKPSENLYWGCTEGLSAYFKHHPRWKLMRREDKVSSTVLERLEFKHVNGKIELVADAYRGCKIRDCLADFERCLTSGKYDLVAYIGHNGLMDFELPEPVSPAVNKTAAVVLCCKSNLYFGERLKKLRAKPVLLTEQFMYPGSFILHAVIEKWFAGGSLAEIRNAAGKAYSENQNISIKAATGVFTRIDELPQH